MSVIDQIAELLDAIPTKIEAFGRVNPDLVHPDSELAADDAVLAGLRPSTNIQLFLAIALDNMNALHTLMREESVVHLPIFAQYPLMRAAMESTAQAVWLLAPNDHRRRVVRSLRLNARDSRNERALYAMHRKHATAAPFGKLDPSYVLEKAEAIDELHRRTRRTAADRLGITEAEYEREPAGYAAVINDAAYFLDDDSGGGREAAEALWRRVSGLAHPSTTMSVQQSLFIGSVQSGEETISSMTDAAGFVSQRGELSALPEVTLGALLFCDRFFDAALLLWDLRSSPR